MTKACIYVMTGKVLREKLGLPPDVQIVAVGRDEIFLDTFTFTLQGIGQEVTEGRALHRVSGAVQLETEGDLQWVIR